jgi:hypothetical protein
MSLDRLNEAFPDEVPPSQVIVNTTTYIRSEYFKDGSRVFFSPLDFALNGPKEGTIMERDCPSMGLCKVKVLSKHYEHNSETPSFVECLVTKNSREYKVWLIVRATPTVIDKFRFQYMARMPNHNFAIIPDYVLENKLPKNPHTPYNDASFGFAAVTGISIGTRIPEDLT